MVMAGVVYVKEERKKSDRVGCIKHTTGEQKHNKQVSWRWRRGLHFEVISKCFSGWWVALRYPGQLGGGEADRCW
jgi:hypothetical protein